MVNSANELWRVDPGFDPQNLLTMTISLPNNKFEWRHNVAFSRDVMRSLTSLPGVRDAAVIQGIPMRAGSFYTSFSVEGRPVLPVERPSARLRVVSPGYFRVMRIPVVAGRDYDERDEIGEVGSLPSVNREPHIGGPLLARSRRRRAENPHVVEEHTIGGHWCRG
jgi:putative ABC transport system permease protein